MPSPDPRETNPTGPGCVMIAAILVGAVVGLRNHQSTIGLLSGMGAALLIAILFWAWDRRR